MGCAPPVFAPSAIASAAQQGGVGRIHNGVNRLPGNITLNNGYPVNHEYPLGGCQLPAYREIP